VSERESFFLLGWKRFHKDMRRIVKRPFALPVRLVVLPVACGTEIKVVARGATQARPCGGHIGTGVAVPGLLPARRLASVKGRGRRGLRGGGRCLEGREWVVGLLPPTGNVHHKGHGRRGCGKPSVGAGEAKGRRRRPVETHGRNKVMTTPRLG
jgi:hypothetical protein